MSETSKNKIYYNDNENSVADVLADMKKMAESTDKAIENSKYNDAQIKKDISDAKKEQALKDAEQDNKIIELQTEKAKLETELKEIQEDFYQASIRGQASGEYIHVEDSSGARCKIGISGNHEQETRNGKNKIEITKTTTTVNGCTHTIKDGTDTLSGTSSTNWANLIIYSFVGDGKTYTLSGSPSTSKNIFISAHDNVQKKDLATSKNGSTGTFVATSGNSIDIIICVAPNLTLANELFKPQLEEGLKATGYEQGGVMPSPNYPSKIETVGDNLNLLDIDKTTYDLTINLQKEGEYLKGNNVNNIRIGTFNDSRPQIEEKLKSGNYTISYEVEANSNVTILNLFLCVIYEDDTQENVGSGKSYSLEEGTKQKVFWTLNVQKNVKKMGIVSYLSNSCDIIVSKVKIEKGKVATPYSKYGQGCVKVTKCNKNLAIKNVKGYFSTSGFKIKIDNNSESFLFYAEKGKEYTRSCKVNLDRNRIGKIDTLDVTQGMTVLNGQEINSKKFICDDSGIYIWFVNSTLNDSIKESFQIEESSTESTFVQHEEQSYIMPVQQEMLVNDYLDYDNEEEVHVWGKKILTGDEGWRMPSSNDSNVVFANLSNTNFCDFNSDTDIQYSNHFKHNGIAQGFAAALNKGIGMYSLLDSEGCRYEYIVVPKTVASSVNKWKEYLKSQYDAGTPVVIYYKQQTPTRLKFTDEQKAVAKELSNARTYKNVTNITTDSKAILSLDYAKDQETQNKKMQNEIDEIKQLLSTTQTSAMLLDNLQKEVESEVK